jgi:hypothetical protein
MRSFDDRVCLVCKALSEWNLPSLSRSPLLASRLQRVPTALRVRWMRFWDIEGTFVSLPPLHTRRPARSRCSSCWRSSPRTWWRGAFPRAPATELAVRRVACCCSSQRRCAYERNASCCRVVKADKMMEMVFFAHGPRVNRDRACVMLDEAALSPVGGAVDSMALRLASETTLLWVRRAPSDAVALVVRCVDCAACRSAAGRRPNWQFCSSRSSHRTFVTEPVRS